MVIFETLRQAGKMLWRLINPLLLKVYMAIALLLSFSGTTHASGGHLSVLVLHDEPEPVAGDGHDAEGRHEDGEVLTGLHELAQVLGVLSR